MRQIGIVREITDGHALVEVSRKSACEGCHANAEGSCSACISFGSKSVISKADNSIGAAVGDRVVLESASGTVIFYAAAVFLFPLILGVIGYFVGALFRGEAAPYIGAVAGFVIAFIVVALTLNRYAEKHNAVRITEILPKTGVSC